MIESGAIGMWKKIIIAMMLLCGISSVGAADVFEGFEDKPFAKESGYPGELPLGWVHKKGERGHQIRNPKVESFFAGICETRYDEINKSSADTVAQCLVDRMELTPEEASKVIRIRSQYGTTEFSGYRLNHSKRKPYMVVDYFIYKGKSYLIFTTDNESQDEMDKNREILLTALFGTKVREVENH